MAKAIEETIKKCSRCKKPTVHMRNTEKTSAIMFLVHLVLTVLTAGVWLIILVIWLVLNAKLGGWICKECGK